MTAGLVYGLMVGAFVGIWIGAYAGWRLAGRSGREFWSHG